MIKKIKMENEIEEKPLLPEVKKVKYVYSLKERMELVRNIYDLIDAKAWYTYRYRDSEGVIKYNMTQMLDDMGINRYTFIIEKVKQNK